MNNALGQLTRCSKAGSRIADDRNRRFLERVCWDVTMSFVYLYAVCCYMLSYHVSLLKDSQNKNIAGQRQSPLFIANMHKPAADWDCSHNLTVCPQSCHDLVTHFQQTSSHSHNNLTYRRSNFLSSNNLYSKQHVIVTLNKTEVYDLLQTMNMTRHQEFTRSQYQARTITLQLVAKRPFCMQLC